MSFPPELLPPAVYSVCVGVDQRHVPSCVKFFNDQAQQSLKRPVLDDFDVVLCIVALALSLTVADKCQERLTAEIAADATKVELVTQTLAHLRIKLPDDTSKLDELELLLTSPSDSFPGSSTVSPIDLVVG